MPFNSTQAEMAKDLHAVIFPRTAGPFHWLKLEI